MVSVPAKGSESRSTGSVSRLNVLMVKGPRSTSAVLNTHRSRITAKAPVARASSMPVRRAAGRATSTPTAPATRAPTSRAHGLLPPADVTDADRAEGGEAHLAQAHLPGPARPAG